MIPKSKLPVRWMRLDDLHPAAFNPKRHDVFGVAMSIRRHGYHDLGVFDERTNRLIGGHGRSDSVRWLRDNPNTDIGNGQTVGTPDQWPGGPGGIHVDSNGDWWLATSTCTTANDAEADALLIALNSGDRPGWDQGGLGALLDQIRRETNDLSGTGYSDDDLDKMLADIEAGRDELPDAPPLPDTGERDTDAQFEVVIACDSEQHQRDVLTHLADLLPDLTVRAIVA